MPPKKPQKRRPSRMTPLSPTPAKPPDHKVKVPTIKRISAKVV